MNYSRRRGILHLFLSLWLLPLLIGTHTTAKAQVGMSLAWGYNNHGQLGDGTDTEKNNPVQAYGLTGVVQVSGGDYHALALKSDGTVWAWGYNADGELGDGTNTDKKFPAPVFGLTGVVQVSAGYSHSLALKSDGTVWAWGDNYWGQLGDGTKTVRNTPVQVSGLTNVVQVSGGGFHSLALKSDGTLWAWGMNGYSQLGDGSLKTQPSPVQVYGLTGAVQVSAGGYYSLAVKSDGTVWAWGFNFWGQFGNGSNFTNLTPLSVPGLTGVVQVFAGYSHALFLKSDGTAWAAGNNAEGQLGDGTNNSRNTPVQVSGLTGVGQVFGGFAHSLALKSDGTVWAWGYNAYGGLGDGTNTDQNTPVQVLNITNQSYIGAGYQHSLSVQAAVQTTKISPIAFTLQLGAPIPAKLVNLKYNTPILQRALAFNLDGNDLGTANTIASGIAYFRVPDPTSYGPGSHTLVVNFAGDSLYSPSTRTITLNITKANTNFAPLANFVGVYGNTRVFAATLRRSTDGAKLTNQTVTFKIDGNVIATKTTNSVGVATLNYKLETDLAPGDHTYSAEFAGDTNHNSASVSGKLTINPSGTSIAPLSNLVGVYGNTRTLVAVIKRVSDGTKLANKTITFKVDGTEVGTGTTDATGKAAFNYKLDDSLAPQTHSYSAEFAGDTNYYASSNGATLTVNVADTTLTEQDATGIAGRNVTFYATLRRLTDGAKVSGRTITYTLDGSIIGTATTVAGISKFTYKLPSSIAKGTHSLGVSFSGDDHYNNSSAAATLTVN